jgi:hypothetical protein
MYIQDVPGVKVTTKVRSSLVTRVRKVSKQMQMEGISNNLSKCSTANL